MLSAMLYAVYYTYSKRNNELVNAIKSGLSDLKDEIEQISKDEIKIGKPYKIVNIVEMILELNRQNQE